MRTSKLNVPGAYPPGVIFAATRKPWPPEAVEAASRIEHPDDVSLDDICAEDEALEQANPAEHKRQERIQRAYDEGDLDLAVAMEETGHTERQARKVMAEEDYWNNLRENNPAEFTFQQALMWWKANLRRLLKAGEISYDAIMASPTPLHTLDIPPDFWPRMQAWVRANVPWTTEGQRVAYERGYHERQRAHAIRLFSRFTPQRRAREWRAHYRKKMPPAWWHNSAGGDTKAWAIHRAELARLVLADRHGAAR